MGRKAGITLDDVAETAASIADRDGFEAATLALRALLHGFLDLEAQDGFGMPVDIDASFDASVELIIAGIEAAGDEASYDERQPFGCRWRGKSFARGANIAPEWGLLKGRDSPEPSMLCKPGACVGDRTHFAFTRVH